ncbi:hypothetical protein IFM89_019547 [Coptis chinensis]|uniref:F-box domain-containing protein n=1 Tax=Coptis chinensis TaxID=261450 RepID=A0A835LVQ0_9MAGN|nr:hypothetical protein IFM89_019547 [Coptis chinensis]
MEGSLNPNKKLKSPEKIKKKIDRISRLPEEVLHHILSFLDMSQIIQTSLLSKRWRYIWVSLPYLNFNDLAWKSSGESKCFIDFVHNVLLYRDNSPVYKFCLDCFICDRDRSEDRICSMVIAAVRKNTQEVHVNIRQQEIVELPHSVFVSEIRVFTLHTDFPVQLPNSVGTAAHLKTLKLVSAKLPKGDLNGELVLSCPVLEILLLHNCESKHLNVFTISAFVLKNLVVNHSYFPEASPCKIKICTPNLLSLRLECDMYKDYSLEKLSSLVSAKLQFSLSLEGNAQRVCRILEGLYSVTTLTWTTDSGHWLKHNGSGVLEQIYNVGAFIGGLCNTTNYVVTTILLSKEGITKAIGEERRDSWIESDSDAAAQAFLASPGVLDRLHKPFHNLKYLMLCKYNAFYLNEVVRFLGFFPYLKTLSLQMAQDRKSRNSSSGHFVFSVQRIFSETLNWLGITNSEL